MPRGAKKKTNPRILSKDIYSYIAHNSSLTVNQVRECFDTYYSMMIDLASSGYRMNDLTVCFPKLGSFYFIKIKGRKKGTVYHLPLVNEDSSKSATITLEKDEPSFSKMRFRCSPTLLKKLKEVSKHYEEEQN